MEGSGLSDLFEINDEQSEESKLPSYNTPGRILVEISNILDKDNFYRYELTVHDYDSDTSGILDKRRSWF